MVTLVRVGAGVRLRHRKRRHDGLAAVDGADCDPFTFATEQPIVPVQVNGGPAVPFVVDIGGSIHLIDREIARQAAVGAGCTVPLSGGGQATVQTQFVDAVSLATGRPGLDRAACRAGKARLPAGSDALHRAVRLQ